MKAPGSVRCLLAACLSLAAAGCASSFRSGPGKIVEDATFDKVSDTTYSVAATLSPQMVVQQGNTYFDHLPPGITCAYLSVGQRTATKFVATMRDCATGNAITMVGGDYYYHWILLTRTKVVP